MSRFNLNERGLMNNPVSPVFNNGMAGKVEGVKLEVEKRRADEPDTYPAYKLVISDDAGNTVNQGFYHFTPSPQKTDQQNEAMSGYLIDRIQSASDSVVPEGFVYPEIVETGDYVKDTNTAVDVLFKVIKENQDNNKVNVFVTYGTKQKPSKYLNLRYFNFIEKTGQVGYSKLIEKGDDLMDRIKEDAPQTTGNPVTQGPAW